MTNLRVKILCDGKRETFRLVDANTGEPVALRNLRRIDWHLDNELEQSVCILTLVGVPIEVTTEATVNTEPTPEGAAPEAPSTGDPAEA